ncbi:hypothetical protein WOLCODRAFT_146889 [Wolfiporia cocos MD-104 SS10]|uniref:Uncharacterized protein n=1 Tax=Wolfiporia cocos (strain MD-104) TaxID=742152 RepID=A0A2H3JRF8_WOLCO|nr:hypothetical protein WOLCODRAFT_146889 [Wolfiporia cocos MD-104 SS10]
MLYTNSQDAALAELQNQVEELQKLTSFTELCTHDPMELFQLWEKGTAIMNKINYIYHGFGLYQDPLLDPSKNPVVVQGQKKINFLYSAFHCSLHAEIAGIHKVKMMMGDGEGGPYVKPARKQSLEPEPEPEPKIKDGKATSSAESARVSPRGIKRPLPEPGLEQPDGPQAGSAKKQKGLDRQPSMLPVGTEAIYEPLGSKDWN